MIAVVQERQRTHNWTAQLDSLGSKLETIYWIQRRLNHRGKADFVREAAGPLVAAPMRG